MDELINDGTFARALKEKKPIITHTMDMADEVMIHVLTTESRVRGMFMGVLGEKSKSINESSMALLSIIMIHTANALESFELYGSLKKVNHKLEEKIHHLSASEKELIRHREQLDKLVKERTRELEKVNEQLKDELHRKQVAENALIKSREELLLTNEKLETSIKHAREMADEAMMANKAKTEFLSAMSHELRTPMNSIIGFSEVLISKNFGPLNDKQEKYVKNIHIGGKLLANLINNILDYTDLESGNIRIIPESVNIVSLLEGLVRSYQNRSKQNEITLEIIIPDGIGRLKIPGDESKLIQAFENILDNAFKFTQPKDKITVTIEKENEMITVIIADTGIGIAEEHLEPIFDLFYQVKGGISNKTPGTGLGLTLAKKIVQHHGGKLWAESEGEGKGSRFVLELPTA